MPSHGATDRIEYYNDAVWILLHLKKNHQLFIAKNVKKMAGIVHDFFQISDKFLPDFFNGTAERPGELSV